MLSIGVVSLLLLLITLSIIVAITWSTYPVARYVKISRGDNNNSYIAIGHIEVVDVKGNKVEFVTMEGIGQDRIAWSGSTEAKGSTAAPVAGATGAVTLVDNGSITKGYVRDRTSTTSTYDGKEPIGPVMGFLSSAAAPTGNITYVLNCKSKIAKINIRAVEDDLSKKNMQGIKVQLLDNDRNPISGTEKITPYSMVPKSVHHFTYG